MDYLPIFAKLDSLPCVVVGGGDVAWRKISLLLNAGARVTVVAPFANHQIQDAALTDDVVWIDADFVPEQLSEACLVIAATNDPLINAQVATAAKARHIFVNVVDDPVNCSVIFPAIVDRSPIVIAISSAGNAPVLVRMLREKLETLIPFHVGRMAALAGQFRSQLKQKIATLTARRKFWEMAFAGRFNLLVAVGDEAGAKKELARLTDDISMTGEVAMIGVGPGDPSLLTLRALQLMQQADVVFYDEVIATDIIALCRRDATLICEKHLVTAEQPHLSPSQINALLVDYAQQGKRVARLKEGDPFTFGRGADELQRLAQSGVAFQVVPGVSAAITASVHDDTSRYCVNKKRERFH